MPSKTINTEREKALSNQRKGARKVRSAIQEKIEQLQSGLAEYDPGSRAVLEMVSEFISSMIERDKKRKGGLWN